MSAVREIAITAREVTSTAALIALFLILAIKPAILRRILKRAGIRSVKLPGDLEVEVTDIAGGLSRAKQEVKASQESMSLAQAGHTKLDSAVSELLGANLLAPQAGDLASTAASSKAALMSTEERLARAQAALDTALQAQRRLVEKLKRAID